MAPAPILPIILASFLAGAALLHLATGLHLVLPHLYTALSDAAVLRSRIPSPQRADALAAQRALLSSLFPGVSGGSLLSLSWPAGLLTAAYALLLLATAAAAATAQGVVRRATAVAALVLAAVPVAAAYARGLVLASSAASPALRLALPASSRSGRLTAADEVRALVDLALLAAVAAAAFAAAAVALASPAVVEAAAGNGDGSSRARSGAGAGAGSATKPKKAKKDQ
ncbi:hypothetical protein HK405_004967 [Cladochytrium tenue]|nr:hypothetical protein HK405_004967 [Cladochytrium tenue]